MTLLLEISKYSAAFLIISIMLVKPSVGSTTKPTLIFFHGFFFILSPGFGNKLVLKSKASRS